MREKMVKQLQERFAGWNLKFSIGGEISFDVFPAVRPPRSLVATSAHSSRSSLLPPAQSGLGQDPLPQVPAGVRQDLLLRRQDHARTRCLLGLLVALHHATHSHYGVYDGACAQGGNDYEIFSHPDVVGNTVVSPEDTMRQVRERFMQ